MGGTQDEIGKFDTGNYKKLHIVFDETVTPGWSKFKIGLFEHLGAGQALRQDRRGDGVPDRAGGGDGALVARRPLRHGFQADKGRE